MQADLSRVAVVIPSYKPPGTLFGFVEKLQTLGFSNIIVINDGSPQSFQEIFDSLPKVLLLSNNVNQGKGAALKKAFHYLSQKSEDFDFVLTCDDDGQHHYEDVFNLAKQALANKSAVYLGVRSFHKGIPAKSLVGNTFMTRMFSLLLNKKITDTQTGLRCIPVKLIPDLLDIKEAGFSFETLSLVHFIRKGIPIQEVSIKTIYFADNKSTRFRPIKDSLKVVFSLIKNHLS